VCGVGKNGLDQSRMIEDGIARFGVAQKIDQRNLVRSRAGERAHDEIEIRSGEPRPTIRPDHRTPIISNGCASWQAWFVNVRSLGGPEGVGFEPTVPLCGTLDFESSALNRTQPPFPKAGEKHPTPKVQHPTSNAKFILGLAVERLRFAVCFGYVTAGWLPA